MSPEKSDGGPEAASLPDADSATKSGSNGDDRGAQPISTASGPTTCSVCQSTFRRPEHLKRHFRSHTKEKPFECNQCGRHFSRTDTLHRHELSHHTLGSEGGKDRTHRITVKTFRACFKCAVARVRCSGGDPCGRCENRSLECQYPTERRSKAKGRKEAPQDLLSVKNEVSYEQSARQIPSPSTLETSGNTARPPSQGPGYEIGQFQVRLNDPTASNSPSTTPAGIHSTEPAKRLPNGRQNAQRDSEAGEPPSINQLPVHSYDKFHALQAYPRISTSNIRSVPPTSNPQPRASSEATIIGTSVQTAVANSHQSELAFARPFLDQATLSALNWYPNEMLLGAVNENSDTPGIHPQSFQTAPSSGALSQSPFIAPVVDRSFPEDAAQRPTGRTPLGINVGSPEFSVNGSDRSLRPQSETSSSKKRAADYANNAGLRLTKYQRRRNSSDKARTGSAGSLLNLHKEDALPQFSIPMLEGRTVDAKFETQATGSFKIEIPTYDSIYESFRGLCCAEDSLYQKFESANFPTAESLSSFITLFFASFQPIYPILHRPTFNPNTCPWLVTLAVTAIGCQYAEATEQDKCAQALHEFLRRAISVEKEKYRLCETPFWLLQAACLNCIGILHGRNERCGAAAFSSFSDLVNLAMRDRLLAPSGDTSMILNDALPEEQWSSWIEDEARRRTAYLIWLVDCTLAYHFDYRPMLSLDDGQAPLPAHERLWQAKSAVAWRKLYDEFPRNDTPSLYDAALIMYIEKNIVPWAGEFSQILMIHALYHRMWEVGDYFRRPLSFWNPTARKQSRDSAIPSGSVWLPGIPSYSKWRNSACDSLDILHWSANSTIAQAGGLEHPPVLHLHEARIILLSPFQEIRTLATSLVTGKIQWEDHEQTIEWHHIIRWIRHDQYKARLAVIHSGKTLHSVRQYSTNAFHEPVAVFLATLTLWAYSLCQTMMLPDVSSSTQGPIESPSIQLDSSCDDELVQAFVREGHAMKAIVTDVGDICGAHGPERILQVGCEALAALRSWGISRRLEAILTGLEEISSR